MPEIGEGGLDNLSVEHGEVGFEVLAKMLQWRRRQLSLGSLGFFHRDYGWLWLCLLAELHFAGAGRREFCYDIEEELAGRFVLEKAELAVVDVASERAQHLLEEDGSAVVVPGGKGLRLVVV